MFQQLKRTVSLLRFGFLDVYKYVESSLLFAYSNGELVDANSNLADFQPQHYECCALLDRAAASYAARRKLGREDSNFRPPRCQRGALHVLEQWTFNPLVAISNTTFILIKYPI